MRRLLDVLRRPGADGTKRAAGRGVRSVLRPARRTGGRRCLVPICRSRAGSSGRSRGCRWRHGSEGPIDALQSILDHGAAQCGICTPGMIMAARAYLDGGGGPGGGAIARRSPATSAAAPGTRRSWTRSGRWRMSTPDRELERRRPCAPNERPSSMPTWVPSWVPRSTPRPIPTRRRRSSRSRSARARSSAASRCWRPSSCCCSGAGAASRRTADAGRAAHRHAAAPVRGLRAPGRRGHPPDRRGHGHHRDHGRARPDPGADARPVPIDELRGISLETGVLVLGARTTYTEIRGRPSAGNTCGAGRGGGDDRAAQIQNRGTLGGNIANASPR